jgi:nucleoside-diphosphate-sugar epimerase
MALTVLFVGGTGQISLPCVSEAVKAGHRVSVLNRGQTDVSLPKGVESIRGDVDNAASYAEMGNRHFDVVCQFKTYTPEQMQRDIDTFAGKTGQYIFISSASVYQKPSRHYVITEKTPLANPFWTYSSDKIACERMLREQSKLAYTIVRPAHTVRTELPTDNGEGETVTARLLAGKPIIVHGDGTSIWTVTRSQDFAVPFIRLFGDKRTLADDFQITNDRGFMWNHIYEAIAAGLGVQAKIVHVPSDTLALCSPAWKGPLLGDNSWSALFDNSKVKGIVGDFKCSTDLAEIVAEPVANAKARYAAGRKGDASVDRLMDRIIAAQQEIGHNQAG